MCVWQELATIRNSSWVDFLTQMEPSCLSSLFYLPSIVVFLLFAYTLPLWATSHANIYCAWTISVTVSNGPEAQARTGLSAAGLISRHTWSVPTLMPGLIYFAWVCQQLPSEISPELHFFFSFFLYSGVDLAVEYYFSKSDHDWARKICLCRVQEPVLVVKISTQRPSDLKPEPSHLLCSLYSL